MRPQTKKETNDEQGGEKAQQHHFQTAAKDFILDHFPEKENDGRILPIPLINVLPPSHQTQQLPSDIPLLLESMFGLPQLEN